MKVKNKEKFMLPTEGLLNSSELFRDNSVVLVTEYAMAMGCYHVQNGKYLNRKDCVGSYFLDGKVGIKDKCNLVNISGEIGFAFETDETIGCLPIVKYSSILAEIDKINVFNDKLIIFEYGYYPKEAVLRDFNEILKEREFEYLYDTEQDDIRIVNFQGKYYLGCNIKNDLNFIRNDKVNSYTKGELVFFEIEPISMIASPTEDLARPINIIFSGVSFSLIKEYLNGTFLDDINTFTSLIMKRRKLKVKSKNNRKINKVKR